MIEPQKPQCVQAVVTGSAVVFEMLNLYACLGGNRYLWDEVAEQAGIKLKVTAVELDPELARMYQERFPNDTVIVTDAHKYLIENYKKYNGIWSSPPCPSHSRARYWNSSNYDTTTEAIYPDMKLYEEILFLEHYFKGKYVVENVIPYYEPLIPAKKRGRHLYWTNFILPYDLNGRPQPKGFIETGSKPNEIFHKIDLSNYKGSQRKDKIACNLVDYEVGKTIFETALGIVKAKDDKQQTLF